MGPTGSGAVDAAITLLMTVSWPLAERDSGGTIDGMSQVNPEAVQVKSARALLEKIAKETDGDIAQFLGDLREQVPTLPPHELALAQAMGWVDGPPEFAHLRPEDFASNQLKAFYFSSVRCHLSLTDVIALGTRLKGGPFLKWAKSRVGQTRTEELISASQFVVDEIGACLAQGDRTKAGTRLKTVALGLQLPVSGVQAKLLLETVYAQFDPNVRSTWPKAITELALDWLTLPINREALDTALSISTELTPASFGNLLMALSRVRVEPDTCKFVLIDLLVRRRERPLVTALAQANVFDDFKTEDFGFLLSQPQIEQAARDNQRVSQNLRDAIARRLKRDHPVEVLLATSRFERLAFWCDQMLIARKIAALKLPIVDAIVSDQVDKSVGAVRVEVGVELDRVKNELSIEKTKVQSLGEELEAAKALAKSWEDRLRQNVNSGVGAREEELRAAQSEIVRDFVNFIDEVQRSRESRAAVDSLVQHCRRELRRFGVRVDGSEGDEVEYDPRLHDGSGLAPGVKCRLESPVYVVKNTSGEIVLKKGTVSPK
jgi:hypothetical protein